MKILFVVSEFPKLSETFILNQIVGLIDEGHEITILSKTKENNTKIHSDIEKYGLLNNVIYYGSTSQLTKFQKILGISQSFVKHYLRKFFKKGYNGRIQLRDLIKHPNLVLLLEACNDNEMKFDVIHAHFGPNGILMQKLIDIKLVQGSLFTTFHGYDMLKFVEQKGEDVYRHLFESDNTLLPISEFWEKKLIELGASPNKILVHRMGIDISRFEFSPLTFSGKIKILSIARLVEKKGIKYGISAVGKLIKQGYDVEYSIIGGGPLASRFHNIIFKDQLNNHIKMLGWKTQEEIISIIKDSHIILLPSVTSKDGDMEGIPVILMEAMAMGKIVISTYHSGIPELIENKKNGYLVNEKDVEGLYHTLQEVCNTMNAQEDINYNARETIINEYNIKSLNEKLSNIFKEKKLTKQNH
ncbi:glycosyltransferase [Priestia megaterium]|uniref:glycosyltransferase n=1 Tax=Priestia megaterium TaxID=1404 RepID=UPI000BFC17B2|nr:glycosyltransferase [Priestia megaterium]PGR03775.1 colanic acid biosynthesis glycosyltransferase WcaL [Priestia megaterium]